ncbi:MAG: cation:proton antiporter subunit C [Verrucomicrobiales bacterium]|mgnify:CR=1 FL=1
MDPIVATFIEENIVPNFNYWIYVILMMIGLYAMITKNNLIKKLIGMAIFQTAIILFYVSVGVKDTAGIPIISHHGSEHHQMADLSSEAGSTKEIHNKIDKDKYANPLPHVLMLTAIVVGVSTLGLALAISQKIYKSFGTLEEDEILSELRPGGHD